MICATSFLLLRIVDGLDFRGREGAVVNADVVDGAGE